MFRILSLDGGGLRGAFGAGFLAALERRVLPATGRPLAAHFDLLAGASTGGILACGLASGLSAERLVQFYREQGPEIFHPREPFRPRTSVRPLYPLANWIFQRKAGLPMDEMFRARYCPFHLTDAFVTAFGDLTLGELEGVRLIVPAVNLSKGRIHLFRTGHLPGGRGCQRDLRIVDLLVAATAAPTYFPHKVIDGEAYCDGGVWANNPTVLAVAEAVALTSGAAGLEDAEHDRRSDFEKAVDVTGIEVLSVGTGRATYSLSPPGADAGSLYWARHIADVMGHSMQQGTELPAEFFLGDRLMGVNFDLPDDTWTLDAADKLEALFEKGEAAAEEVGDEAIGRFFASREPSVPREPPAANRPAPAGSPEAG
ncbi:patatin-like phospholipase family protein [Alienimonas sp. DA493]|uniref:patatin-like phospholipase family protein n=1 Tax=Alienimonas sp. DA493 TaxID=3373605 RepID=UPI003754A601